MRWGDRHGRSGQQRHAEGSGQNQGQAPHEDCGAAGKMCRTKTAYFSETLALTVLRSFAISGAIRCMAAPRTAGARGGSYDATLSGVLNGFTTLPVPVRVEESVA